VDVSHILDTDVKNVAGAGSGTSSVKKDLAKLASLRALAAKDDDDPLSRPPPQLRPLSVNDFKEAMKQVGTRFAHFGHGGICWTSFVVMDAFVG
jgi:hypothetical protein